MRLHLQSVALVVFRILCLHAEVSRIAWFAVSFAARTRSPCACAFLCHFAVSVVCLAVSSCLASRPIAPASVPLRYGGTRRQSRHAEDGLGRVLCRGCVHVLPPRSPAALPGFRTVRVSLSCACVGVVRAPLCDRHMCPAIRLDFPFFSLRCHCSARGGGKASPQVTSHWHVHTVGGLPGDTGGSVRPKPMAV